ncbi:MAG: hypothetical protein WD802_00395 [Gemmatimonadaceae bacterium]
MDKRAAGCGALSIAATVASVTSAPLSAQTLAPLAYSQSVSRDSSVDNDSRIAFRLVTAAVVGAAGAAALGRIGYERDRNCPSCGDPDSPGFVGAVLGVLAGGTIGSAIGAALPRGRGLCHGGERFARTLGGATLGLAAGIGLFMVPTLEGGFIVTIPVGSVLFMRRC